MTSKACEGTPNEVTHLEHIQARIYLMYKPRGALKISLISPMGTVSHLLFSRPRDVNGTTFYNWPFTSVHYWGERAAGTWRLIIYNDSPKSVREPGILKEWSLVFYGTYGIGIEK
jgi:subtilisin-like proprotein convertase family protein